MTKVIPRNLIKHLEWKPGQEVAPIKDPINQSTQPLSTRGNQDNLTYDFLEGDFGKQILDEYNQLVQNEYQNVSDLQKLSFENNVVKGSNPFAFVLLNKVLQDHGKWVARPADLERALEKESINLKGTYGDSGLVLRSNTDPNQYLAQNLIAQIKQREELQSPLMIPLEGLDLKYDSSSPNDLSFQLTNSTELIYAPQLDKTNHEKKFNNGDKQGLPILDENGSRTLYSNEGEGLCRLYRYWDLGLDARGRSLSSSNSSGRVIVCAEGTSPKK
jgi:hypothetical protein